MSHPLPFTLDRWLTAVSRVIADGTRDETPTKTVSLSVCIAAEGIWHALTDAERLCQWFLPISGDLKPGGRYQFEGNAGGTITACTPSKHIALTWEYGGDMSWLTLDLATEADGTRLTLSHQTVVADAFWETYGPGATAVGWDMALMGLERHLLDPAGAPKPDEAEAWATSPEGRAFIRATSTAWGEIDAASGTPTAKAMAAAEQSRAFYTGDTTPTG